MSLSVGLIIAISICLIVITLFIIKYLFIPKKKDLKGQVVLVTGGANGLGKELCKIFACLGCKVAIADVDFANAVKTAREIISEGISTQVRAYKVDVSKLKEIENLKSNIEKHLGVVDIVVNNAAILYTKSIEEEDPVMLEKIIQVNVMALFWTTRVFLKAMKEQKRGHIISISSTAGLIGCPQLHSYSTSKFAVRGFMESLAVDLKREGHCDIQTTTVYPWFMNTREYIQEFTNQLLKYCFVFDTEYAANQIIEGIRTNQQIVTIPGFFYLFGYVINVTGVVNYFMNFIGTAPNQEFVFKDNPI